MYVLVTKILKYLSICGGGFVGLIVNGNTIIESFSSGLYVD